MKRLRRWLRHLWYGKPISHDHYRVRCSPYGVRYVLVSDLFLDPETVELMQRAADPKVKGFYFD